MSTALETPYRQSSPRAEYAIPRRLGRLLRPPNRLAERGSVLLAGICAQSPPAYARRISRRLMEAGGKLQTKAIRSATFVTILGINFVRLCERVVGVERRIGQHGLADIGRGTTARRNVTATGSLAWEWTSVSVRFWPMREAEPATRKICGSLLRIERDRGRIDLHPHPLGPMVGPVHLEDVEVGSRDELVAVGQEQRVEVVDELCDVGHVDFVRMAVERVEREGRTQGVAQTALLFQQVPRIDFRSLRDASSPIRR